MSYLDGKHLTTPGTSTYWVISVALTCGGMTSHAPQHAYTADDLARQLAVVAKRPDQQLLGVYRHDLVITELAYPMPLAEVAELAAVVQAERPASKPETSGGWVGDQGVVIEF